MIDLNKKYTLKNGSEVHLYDILDNVVYGRYYDKCSLKWYLDSWDTKGHWVLSARLNSNLDLVEVPTFKVEQMIVREMKRQNYLGVDLYVPSTVNYIAVDNDGKIYGYQSEPRCGIAIR